MGFSLGNIAQTFQSGGLSNLFGGGAKPGPVNPYGAPNLNFLNDSSKFDFLKNPVGAGIMDPSSKYFQDLLTSISAPSSVDEATKNIESQSLDQALQGIDKDTADSIAAVHSDALDRGIGGAGIASEIESSGVGTAAATGAKTKAGARIGYALQDLARQKEKEQAVQKAYSDRFTGGEDIYKTLLGLDTQQKGEYASILNNRDIASSGNAINAYGSGVDQKYKYAKPSYLDDLLRNIQIQVSPKM